MEIAIILGCSIKFTSLSSKYMKNTKNSQENIIKSEIETATLKFLLYSDKVLVKMYFFKEQEKKNKQL